MNPAPIACLADRWRGEAETFRQYGLQEWVALLERHAVDLEGAFCDWWEEYLDIAAAAEWSGYTEGHLRDLVRDCEVPAAPRQERQRILIRRCDLPKKSPGPSIDEQVVGDIVAERKARAARVSG